MIVSVERLRIWLLVGAGLLVVLIASFLGYAHYRTHRFLTNLPAKLGIDIQQETNGFTYSQSVKGKTIYTVHAAKAVQRKDGKVTLHDVEIVLYGSAGEGEADRVDRIYGKEFEYDQKDGVVRAAGEVHIDLQAPAASSGGSKANSAKLHEMKNGAEDERLIHVKTSGLVFLQKLGVAATEQDLEFQYHGLTGTAHGADYNSDSGLLVLQSAVKVNGLKQGEPVVLTASKAELDRHKQQVRLNHAAYTVVDATSGARVARAENAVMNLRRDGSVERAQADGGVSMTGNDGDVLSARRADARLNGANQPEGMVLSGDVKYVADSSVKQARGEAAEGKADFDKGGNLQHVLLTGGAHLHERARVGDVAAAAWSERDLASSSLDLVVATGNDRRTVLRNATATGNARFEVMNPPVARAKAGHEGATTSVLSGEMLTADFVTVDGTNHVKSLRGTGHTALRRVNDSGAVSTSSGDSIEANFHRVARGGGPGGLRLVKGAADSKMPEKSGQSRKKSSSGNKGVSGQEIDEILNAVQQGHVVMTNLPVAKPGVLGSVSKATEASTQNASADRAVYDGVTEQMTLTGAVRVSDASGVVWADRMVMEQSTGNMAAEGSVRANYQQEGSASDTVHVSAARGEFKHDTETGIFYAGRGVAARLWQGSSEVEAPVLQFQQRERRMVARGDGRAVGSIVHAVFVSGASLESNGANASPTGSGKGRAGDGPNGAKKPVPVRVASHEMTYDDVARRADFTGGVQVEDADGSMRSRQAALYLKVSDAGKTATGAAPAKEKSKAVPAPFMGGSVDRIVASGQVEIEQPGRRVMGEKLVYTGVDGVFIMTGLPGLPPRMVDDATGAVTGASLRFRTGDNSVVVSNGQDGATGQRVRSETRVKQ